VVAEPSAVVLVGLPGAGKSTVGKIVAESLGWSFLDLDLAIEAEVGLTVAEIFSRMGENYFRQLEADLTKRLTSKHQVVFAPGGGWVTNPASFEMLPADALLIWLKVAPQTALVRLRASGVTRPLLQVEDAHSRLEQLLANRSPLYERANVSFDTDDTDPHDVADRICKWLIKQQ
jgi:shikimate kinase